MKNLKLMLFGLASLGIMGVAKAEGETPDKPLRTEAKMKAEVFDQVAHLKLSDFDLEDETVDIFFSCNADGEVMIERVEGGSCVVSEYVSKKLQKRKMYVDESLQNASHHIKVRYVMI